MPLQSDPAQQRETSHRRGIPGAGTARGLHPARVFAPRAQAMPLAGLVLAALIFLAPAVHAATYKWVDDQGVVHYTDKIPPEAINKGSVELNRQGIQVKKTDPALTPEQRRVREAEDERARQAAKVREEIQRKDRALLQSYTTESEIELSKKRALATIEAQIQSAQAYAATLTKRKEDITGRVAALGDKPQPPSLEREVANVNDELQRQAELIAEKRKEIVTVTARYEAAKQRWRELRTIAETEAAGMAAAASTPTTGGTVPTTSKK
jgi:DNA repair exonuclease SbcCD ATPase subunit